MSTDAIFMKYAVALDLGADTRVSGDAVLLALRLAIGDAYAAGSALDDDLAAIVASQAQEHHAALAERDDLRNQLVAVIESIVKLDADNADLLNRVQQAESIHDCEYVDRQMRMIADWLIANSDGQKTARTPGERILDAIEQRAGEIDALRQQLAQLDADNADLTQRLANLAGVQAEAGRLRQEIADLREQVIPDYQNNLASLSAEIDRLTRQNAIAVDTFNSLHTNGNGAAAVLPDTPNVTWWYDGLDAETNDWRISLEAKRRRFGEIPKTQRLLLAQAVARHIGNGANPTQALFNTLKPDWMPMANGIVQGLGVTWAELLSVMPSEVPA